MPEKTGTIEQTLSFLAENPRRIAAAVSGLSPSQLKTPPAEGEWSANEVLAHLRACADVWGEKITAILAADRPSLRGVNPRTWIKKTDYPDLEFLPSFEAYSRQRAELLSVLEHLAPEQWSRTALVNAYGQVNERTLFSYAEKMAHHERIHVRQIERIPAAFAAKS